MNSAAGFIVKWAHKYKHKIPSFVSSAQKSKLNARPYFWKAINDRVIQGNCFLPMKVLKQAAQSYYSKTKDGDDGAAQLEALFWSPISHLNWEQKVFSKVLKAIAVNAFIAYRMCRGYDLLETDGTLKSLVLYWERLNIFKVTADFINDVARELLVCAASIISEETQNKQEEITEETEAQRPISLAKKRKCKHMSCINSSDVVGLSFAVRGPAPIQKKMFFCCALCEQNRNIWGGNRLS